jgi:hypothetical protein
MFESKEKIFSLGIIIAVAVTMPLIQIFHYKFDNNLVTDTTEILNYGGKSDMNPAYYDTLLEDVILKNDFSKLQSINDGVYVFLEGNSDQDFSLSDDFEILDTKTEFLSDRDLYLVRIILSQTVKAESVGIDDFNLEYVEKKLKKIKKVKVETTDVPELNQEEGLAVAEDAESTKDASEDKQTETTELQKDAPKDEQAAPVESQEDDAKDKKADSTEPQKDASKDEQAVPAESQKDDTKDEKAEPPASQEDAPADKQSDPAESQKKSVNLVPPISSLILADEVDAGTQPAPETDNSVQPQSETDDSTQPTPETDTDAQPQAETEDSTQSTPETDTDAQPQAETEDSTQSTPETDTDAQPQSETDDSTQPTPETDDNAQPIPETDNIIEEIETLRRPQFIIINNNEILAGFVVTKPEIDQVDTLSIQEITSTTNNSFQTEKLKLPPPPDASSSDMEKFQDQLNSTDEDRIRTFDNKRNKAISEFVINYYIDENYKDSFKKVGKKIYYFDKDILGNFSGEVLLQKKEQEFFVYDKEENFIQEHEIYFVDMVFSKKLDYEDLKQESFVLMDPENQNFQPDMVFASDFEAVFIFKTNKSLDGKVVKINQISSDEDKSKLLEGYYSLSSVNDEETYMKVKKDAEKKYETSINTDIVFNTSPISFGKLHDKIESESTIAIEIANIKKNEEKCIILVFGNDLKQENGTDLIPINGLSLISQSSGSLPIDSSVVEAMQQTKQKMFLGFARIEDLEILNTNRMLYLKLISPGGLSRGVYQSTLSVELSCPKN